MPSKLSIVIIDPDREAREVIENLVQPYGDRVKILGSSADFNEGYRLIEATNPSIVILGITQLAVGVEQIQNINAHFAYISVFAYTTEKDSDWILRLMHAGAVEYLLKPLDKTDLFEAIQKIGKLWMANNREAVPEKEGKIISVYNPIGGMGTTTIAVNLAVALAEDNNKVALVDLNLFSGDVDTFLDITPRYTLSSVTSNLSRLDASFLMSVMPHHSSGIYLLSEPLEVEETFAITPEQIKQLLTFLKQVFSYVIVDTGGHLYGTNETIFQKSDLILYNTVLSLTSLKNAKRYLSAMDKLGLARDRGRIVANRYLSKSDIRVKDAEKVLDRSVFITIPNEYAEVNNSINKGMPLVSLYPRSNMTKAVFKLAEMIRK